MTTTAPVRRNWGLILCQLAVPALAIPSAIGVAKFFSVADGVEGWTLQGGIAAVGFELTNIGLSILDIRRPALHQVVQRVRFWSVAAAITMNVIAHYATAAAGATAFDLVAGVLALVASVPLALLYVQLAALLHAISEGEHAEADALAELRANLAKARDELASKARELARVARDLAEARETLAAVEAQAREGQAQARAEIAGARDQSTSELARVREEMARAREALAAQERQARETEAAAARAIAAAQGEAREGLARMERERARLTRELEQARGENERLRDRSREALVREALSLAATHGWGSTEIAKNLGWPESTVRGWLTAKPASAAD